MAIPRPKTAMLKVVILGDGGVGKSCLMNRFVSNSYDENSFHTIGVEFLTKEVEVDGERFTLQIWDTAGQEKFRALRTPFYRGSDICILSYAVDDRDSFRAIAQWQEEFFKYADLKQGAKHFPFIVCGCKNDVPPQQRQVSVEEATGWCQEHNITAFIETSAKMASNVTEAFVLAVRQWKKAEKNTERELRAAGHTDLIDLTKRVNLTGSGGCCSGGGSSCATARRANNMNVDRNERVLS